MTDRPQSLKERANLAVWEYVVTCPRCHHPLPSPSGHFAWRVTEVALHPRYHCQRCEINLTVEVPR